MSIYTLVKPCPKPTKQPKKAKNPPIDKQAYLEHRRNHGWGQFCDSGTLAIGTDIHHCLIGRLKGYPVLDDYRNYALVNPWMHQQRIFDNQKWRKYFWDLQCKRYGRFAMLEWVDAVLEAGLDKSRLDFLP